MSAPGWRWESSDDTVRGTYVSESGAEHPDTILAEVYGAGRKSGPVLAAALDLLAALEALDQLHHVQDRDPSEEEWDAAFAKATAALAKGFV